MEGKSFYLEIGFCLDLLVSMGESCGERSAQQIGQDCPCLHSRLSCVELAARERETYEEV